MREGVHNLDFQMGPQFPKGVFDGAGEAHVRRPMMQGENENSGAGSVGRFRH